MALYTYYSLQQMKHWITPSWDLAIFTQMAQAYSHFSVPIVPIKGPDFNLWGDHFHPILVLLGPIYALFPSPTTLLVVQNALVAFASFAIVRFTQRAFALAQKTEDAQKNEPAQNAQSAKLQSVIPTLTGLLLGAGFRPQLSAFSRLSPPNSRSSLRRAAACHEPRLSGACLASERH